MDWYGDGKISGADEQAHSDSWYQAIFTAWLDDWYYGGDYNKNTQEGGDNIIGGYSCDGALDKVGDLEYECDGEWIEDQDGKYSGPDENGKHYLEKGSGKNRKFKTELEEMIYNFGLEYWYSETFVLRLGYIYDYEGKINNPTFGAGLRFGQYGFDFGYTAGEQGHPRANTMFFSINIGV